VPAVQIAEKVAGEANMHLLWANRRREDCTGGVSDTSVSETATGWTLFRWWSASGRGSERKEDVARPPSEKSAAVALLESIKARTSTPSHASTQLKIDYFVDEEGTFIRPDSVIKLLQSSSLQHDSNNGGDRLLFVSGPEGFVNYWAGPKQWANGREIQGPLGGILSSFDLRGWKVVKL